MTDDLAMIGFQNPEHPVPKGQQPNADLTYVSSDYFRTLQPPLLPKSRVCRLGRYEGTAGDDHKPGLCAAISTGEDALGKRLKPGASNGMPGGPPLR